MTELTTVLIVDDHPVTRQGVRHLLAAADDFKVIGEATSGQEALENVERTVPDLAIVDLRLPDMLAPDLCAAIRRLQPETGVLILTAFDDEGPLRACLDAGASGILLKDAKELDLIRTLRGIRDGERIVDNRVVRVLHRQSGTITDDDGTTYEALTPREYDVLRFLARGMTSKEIAAALHLSPNTVRSYTQCLFTKLHSRNRVSCLSVARRLRLI